MKTVIVNFYIAKFCKNKVEHIIIEGTLKMRNRINQGLEEKKLLSKSMDNIKSCISRTTTNLKKLNYSNEMRYNDYNRTQKCFLLNNINNKHKAEYKDDILEQLEKVLIVA